MAVLVGQSSQELPPLGSSCRQIWHLKRLSESDVLAVSMMLTQTRTREAYAY